MPASVPEPIATSELLVLNDVCTRTKEPIFKQVSVPGTYQKPAPYRLQIFTYWTGLALTGRSAACAPATATSPAAEPRRRLFTIFILNLQTLFLERVPYPPSATAPVGTSPCSPLARETFHTTWCKLQPGQRNRGMPPSVALVTLAEG